jgi:hypothetical protein
MAMSTIHPLSYFLYLVVVSCRIVLPWLIFYSVPGTILGLLLTATGSTIVIRRVNKLTGLRIRMRDIAFHELYQILLTQALIIANIIRWPVIWKGEKVNRK